MNAAIKNKIYNPSYFLMIALGFTLFKIICLYFSTMPLWADEAQYWVWSKNLDFGYYSKPPLIAWLISFFTTILGNSEFAIRLPSSILHFLTSLIVFKLAAILFDRRTAFYSGIIYLFLPAVTFSSHFFSTDSLLMFFWALAGLYAVKAVSKNRPKYWLYMGAAVGLGMLSKYTIILFFPSLLMYLLISPEHRKYLLQPWFWLSGITALIVFLPNIIWNLNHQMVSLHHTEDNVLTGGVSIYPKAFLEFAVAQFVVFGLVTNLIFLIYLIRKPLRIFTASFPQRILLCMALPLLGAGLFISLISTAQAHWAAPVYIFASILVANICLELSRIKLLNFAICVNIAASLAFIIFTMFASTIQSKVSVRAIDRLYEWHSVSEPLQMQLMSHPNSVIITDERKSTAILLYNLRDESGNLPPVYKWNEKKIVKDYFDMKFNFQDQPLKNAILVTRADVAHVAPYFVDNVKLYMENIPPKFSAYYLQEFKGY